MNIFELIESKRSSFTKTDEHIYEGYRRFTDEFANSSITDIIKRTGASQPSLTRFAKRLGFSGFQEFQFALAHDMAERPSEDNEHSHAALYGKYLLQLESSAPQEKIALLAKKIMQADTVYIAGVSTSSYPAQYLRRAIRFLHKHALIIANDESFELLSALTKKDLVIDFSASSPTFASSIESINALASKPYTVLISFTEKHPLRKKFNLVISLPSSTDSFGNQLLLIQEFGYFMFLDLLNEDLKKYEK